MDQGLHHLRYLLRLNRTSVVLVHLQSRGHDQNVVYSERWEQVRATDKFVNQHKGNMEGRGILTLLITLKTVQHRILFCTIPSELDQKVVSRISEYLSGYKEQNNIVGDDKVVLGYVL